MHLSVNTITNSLKRLLAKLQASLAARLLLVFIVISSLISALIFFSLAGGFASQWRSNIRPHLLNYLSYINEDIGYPPSLERAQALADRLPINIYIYGGDIQYSSSGKPLDFSELAFHRHEYHGKKPDRSIKKLDKHLTFGEYDDRTILKNSVGEYQIYYELIYKERRKQRDGIIHKSLLVLLLILAFSYFILRRILRPVQDIKQGVNQMRQGNLAYKIPTKGKSDLTDLAQSINTMSSEIDDMLEAKRQLLLALSHELRSPLTRAKLAIQMMDESSYQKQLAEDIEEMETLIADILEAERMNGTHSALNRSDCDIAQLAFSVSQDFPEGACTIDIPDNLRVVHCDETRIKLLLKNLLSNAIKYGGDGEPKPALMVYQDQQNTSFVVEDHGPGIPAADIKKITEPFYRLDPSRNRNTGGLGLGLYLCKVITLAHGGDLNIESEESKFTRVSVSLPNMP